MEDYLETILLLQHENGEARLTDIAQRMKVRKSSVHAALHNLADGGLIVQQKYGTTRLTAEGERLSRAIYARHRALIHFFKDVVGVDAQTAERDACEVEHVLSEETMRRIIELTALFTEGSDLPPVADKPQGE